MRNLIDVINQILEVSTNKELNEKLEQIKFDAGFTAPELMRMRWDLTQVTLKTYILNPLESDETLKIISIFTTKSEEEVRKEFQK
ncbi:hypothetical protein MKX66_28915 [Bacillus sp. FSL R9-9530]|uniref:hypothetical protein n=1 Tax=Bacillus sp. FSL R9-9530 TaxID=2921593 RepID=UPI0030FBB5B5